MEIYSHNKIVLLATLITLALGHCTQVGFYQTTCPTTKTFVWYVVQSAVRANPTIAPGLLRMFFHDCFVNSCDASILIDGTSSEKTVVSNSQLRGFEVIDAACPGVVFFVDILALAACDSVVQPLLSISGDRSYLQPSTSLYNLQSLQ